MTNACAIKNELNGIRWKIIGFVPVVLKRYAVVLSVLLIAVCTGWGTLTGATLDGAAGAGIGAGTNSNVEKSAAIGAGVGGTAGALYDLYDYNRHRDRDYDD